MSTETNTRTATARADSHQQMGMWGRALCLVLPHKLIVDYRLNSLLHVMRCTRCGGRWVSRDFGRTRVPVRQMFTEPEERLVRAVNPHTK